MLDFNSFHREDKIRFKFLKPTYFPQPPPSASVWKSRGQGFRQETGLTALSQGREASSTNQRCRRKPGTALQCAPLICEARGSSDLSSKVRSSFKSPWVLGPAPHWLFKVFNFKIVVKYS